MISNVLIKPSCWLGYYTRLLLDRHALPPTCSSSDLVVLWLIRLGRHRPLPPPRAAPRRRSSRIPPPFLVVCPVAHLGLLAECHHRQALRPDLLPPPCPGPIRHRLLARLSASLRHPPKVATHLRRRHRTLIMIKYPLSMMSMIREASLSNFSLKMIRYTLNMIK